MKQTTEIKKSNHFLVGVRLPQTLHKQLELKSQEMENDNISETIRILLGWALEHPQLDELNLIKKKPQTEINNERQDDILKHLITVYYLIQEQLADLGDKGIKLNNSAHQKADKAIKKTFFQ